MHARVHVCVCVCARAGKSPDGVEVVRLPMHEVGAPGYALLPQSLNMAGTNPANNPRSKSGCNQPGCKGTDGKNTAVPRDSCGHWGCKACTQAGACQLCESSLVYAMTYRGAWIRVSACPTAQPASVPGLRDWLCL